MRLGMTKVHAQDAYVLALRNLIKDRFGMDFIAVEGVIIDLG